MRTQQFDAIWSLGASIEFVAGRDLKTLREVDGAVDKLRDHRGILEFHTDNVHREIGIVKNHSEIFDEDGSLVKRLEQLRDKVGDIHGELRAQYCTTQQTLELRPDDDLMQAYCDIINATADLHNAINDLCWAIGEHDADYDKPTGKSYKSAAEMFADMGL
jgi:hypothetical protein